MTIFRATQRSAAPDPVIARVSEHERLNMVFGPRLSEDAADRDAVAAAYQRWYDYDYPSSGDDEDHSLDLYDEYTEALQRYAGITFTTTPESE